MAHSHSVHDLPAGGEMLDTSKLAGVSRILMIVSAVGLALSVFRFFYSPEAFAYSWLFAFAVVFTISAGGVFWTLLHHATNSGWGIAIRRIMEQVANQILVTGIIGLPLILIPSVRDALWEWIPIFTAHNGSAEELKAAHHTLLAGKHAYLNTALWTGYAPGFYARYALYFIILAFGAWKIRSYSLKQDRTNAVRPTLSARRFACGWLPLFAVSVTFAAIDWLMALSYVWYSTMWGVYIFAGCALSGMAVIIITLSLLKQAGYLKNVVSFEHFHTSGKLMFAFVVFWAYITFSQFFLIWYANITEETQYYILRNTGGWNTGAVFTYLFAHFAIPFLFILPAWVKKNPKFILPMACWVVFAHILDLYFVVIPERGPSITHGESLVVPGAWIWDIVALVTIGCIWAFFYIRTLGKHSLYPCGDPRLHESLNLAN